MSMSDETAPRPTIQSVLGGPVLQFLNLASNIALVAGGVGALWLLASLIFGHYADYATFAKATRLGILQNISLAGLLMMWGLGIGSVLSAIVNFGEEVLGYLLLGGALLVGFGIPFGFQQFGGDPFAATASVALEKVYGAFTAGVLFPMAVGGLLVAYDVVTRLVRTVRERPTVKIDSMVYGTGAKPENNDRPPRTSILGKCWEGPFCRDFIRPHCPVFLKRQACWTNKVGCYCEEEIVSKAAAKVTGQTLPMASRFAAPAPRDAMGDAPDPTEAGFKVIGAASGTANLPTRGMGAGTTAPVFVAPAPQRKMELTAGQKRERCRNCVIYNEHQREKYGLLLPMVILGTILFCGYFAVQFQGNATSVITGIETLINRYSFLPGNNKVEIGGASATVAWLFIGAATVMIMSKTLQLLEWCVFKLKI